MEFCFLCVCNIKFFFQVIFPSIFNCYRNSASADWFSVHHFLQDNSAAFSFKLFDLKMNCFSFFIVTCSLWLILPQKHTLSHSPCWRRKLSRDHLVFLFVSLSLMFSMSCSCSIVGFIVGALLTFLVVIIVVCIILFYMQLSKLYNPCRRRCNLLLSYPVTIDIFATFFQFLFILPYSTWRGYHCPLFKNFRTSLAVSKSPFLLPGLNIPLATLSWTLTTVFTSSSVSHYHHRRRDNHFRISIFTLSYSSSLFSDF